MGLLDTRSKKKGKQKVSKEDHVAQVYDGKGTLEEGEIVEGKFKIKVAYKLLMDTEKRRQYDMDNQVNPMKVCYEVRQSYWYQVVAFDS